MSSTFSWPTGANLRILEGENTAVTPNKVDSNTVKKHQEIFVEMTQKNITWRAHTSFCSEAKSLIFVVRCCFCRIYLPLLKGPGKALECIFVTPLQPLFVEDFTTTHGDFQRHPWASGGNMPWIDDGSMSFIFWRVSRHLTPWHPRFFCLEDLKVIYVAFLGEHLRGLSWSNTASFIILQKIHIEFHPSCIKPPFCACIPQNGF